MARLECCLLGSLVVTLDGKPITGFESNKVRALLAYLAAEGSRSHRREALAELLWPGWPQQSSLTNLRSALADLRKNISDQDAEQPFLVVSRESLRLNPESDCRVDVIEFEQLLAGCNRKDFVQNESTIRRLQSAVGLYRGPFLEGFSLPDSAPLEEWLNITREQHQRQVLQALRLLADHHEQLGEYEQALPYAYRQVEIELWLEEAHQQIMRLLALNGQRSTALAQYETCRKALKDELGVEPADETTRLYMQIRDGNLEELGRDRRITTVISSPIASPDTAGVLQPAKHNLPQALTRFFGRESEIAAAGEWLGTERLLTLTGSGGVGKSRLALRIAEEVLGKFKDGVWFVDLAPLADPARVPQQVAFTLGVREEPNRPIQDSLVSFLQSRQILLVLDNCEHLLDACAQLADSLLQGCPELKVLASSREPLGVAGEAIFRVPSLPFPDPAKSPDMDRLEEYAAIRLFVDRARLVQPDYSVTAQNAPFLVRICQRLDGIPLAIELAAARSGILTAEQLSERLSDTFHLLTGGRRTALPRQQTLRATIDWSYQLLSEKERLLFRRLSVFAGGCTLEAAEAVCITEGLDTGEILDLLGSLVDKSMVLAGRKPGQETRYRLLEMVRQYALEKLADAGESERLRTCHRDYFLKFEETHGSKRLSKEWASWRPKFEAEHENLRLALEWSIRDHPDVDAGIRLILATNECFWDFRYYQEAYDWFERGFVLCQQHAADISPSLYVYFLGTGSASMAFHNPQTGLTWAKQAVEISRRLGPKETPTLIGSLLDLVWRTMWDLDDVNQALEPFSEAEALFQKLDPDQYPEELYLDIRSWMLGLKAELSNKLGRYEDAKRYARESIRIRKKLGRRDIIWELIFLGEAHVNLVEYDQARGCYLEALQLEDEMVDNRRPFILRLLGMLDFQDGNLGQALEYCREGLRLAVEISDNNVVANCLGLSACILAKQGKRYQATGVSGAARELYERQGRKPFEDSTLDTILPGWRDCPDSQAILEAYEAGRTMTVDQAVSLALHNLAD